MTLLIEDNSQTRKHREILSNLIIDAKESIDIASAYVTESRLFNSVSNAKTRILTSISAHDILSGATSIECIKWLIENNIEIRILSSSPKFHPKVYIFDKCKAVVTSANLTNNAMNNNIEIGITCSDSDALELAEWFEKSWQTATPITQEIISELTSIKVNNANETYNYRLYQIILDKEINRKLNIKTKSSIQRIHENSSRFFFCNSDRRSNYRTETNAYYHEELMLSLGYVIAWESYDYIEHMKRVTEGDTIFLFAKNKGVIAIGETLGCVESVPPEEAFSSYAETTEWRIPVRWVTPRDSDLYVKLINHNIRQTFLDISDEKYLDMRNEVFSYFEASGMA